MYSVKDQLPEDFRSVRVLANWMGWFEGAVGKKHRGNVCRSDDPRTVQAQCDMAKAVGIDGFIVDWYGSSDFPTQEATLILMEEAEEHGLEFCLMFDSGITKWLPTTTDKQQAMATQIDYAIANFLTSKIYSKLQGKPVAFEFGWRDPAAGLNGSALATKYPQFTWLSQDSLITGFNGTFGWVNGFPASGDSPYKYIDRMLNAAGMLVPCVFWGFDDTSWRPGETGSIWAPSTPARIISPDFGRLWQYNWNAIVKKYGAKPPEMIQICTWNDYDERTCVEPFALAMTGKTLYL